MPRKRIPLTIEEHKQLGLHMREIEAAMRKMVEVLNDHVPVAILDQLLTGRGVDKALHKLRSDLEELMFKDLGTRGGANIGIYYGKNEGDPKPGA
jgi:hypothetical protein